MLCSKQTNPIEYYGAGFPDKRKYSLTSLLKYYNPTYLSKKYRKQMNGGDTTLKLVTDIKNNLNIVTPQQWQNTPGLKLIDLTKLNTYTVKDIIKILAQWSCDSKKNKNNLKIPIRSHPKFTNVEGFLLDYHKTIPKHIKEKEKQQQELEKQQKNKQLHNKSNSHCQTNSDLEKENKYLKRALENERKHNKHNK